MWLLGSVSSYDEFDEDIEDELDKLMEESRKSSAADETISKHEILGTAESLNKALSDLKLADYVVMTETKNVSATFLDNYPSFM